MSRYQRQGLRIRGQRGHPEVRAALIRFARWLRANFEFPIRVPVYLVPAECLVLPSCEDARGGFFAPFDRETEPYIVIVTGDYDDLKNALGQDSALGAYIVALSHEVIHYRQWVETGVVSEGGVERKSDGMLRRYSGTVDDP